jgi:hypothetical protein
MKSVRRLAVAGIASVVMLTGVSSAGAAGTALPHFGNVTCHGGNIKSGTYRSLRVVGFCTIPDGRTVIVRGNLVVAGNAILDSIHLGTVRVRDDLVVGRHAVLGFGCAPSAGCSATSSDVIGGSLRSYRAAALLIHGNTIRHNIVIRRGGGSMNCASTALFGGPYFLAVEDNAIGGNIRISGVRSCWIGFIRDHVGGSVSVFNNRFGDPDAMEIVTNTIAGNLSCFNNDPHAHFGDSGGSPNVVGGVKRGECRNV